MVTVYSASWCSMCKAVKRKLDDLRIEYREVNVDSKDGFEEAEKLRVTSLPTIKATNQYGSELTYSGHVNFRGLKEFLEA